MTPTPGVTTITVHFTLMGAPMPDKNKGKPQTKDSQRDPRKPFKDLDTRREDMDRVKGGRAVPIADDPCGGGA